MFFQNISALLGNLEHVLTFDPKPLYPTTMDLTILGAPFTVQEIESVVMSLGKNRASGPDGLPSEFLQNNWKDLKDQVIQIIMGFGNNTVDLTDINRANVVMIPKIDSPREVGDFRPISVINVIPKLIYKILARRLAVFLHDLISPFQTAFVKNRQISENFISTREVLHHISKTERPAVFVKYDFKKAFDSIEWSFLNKVMLARGFPEIWIKWVGIILTTASSHILVNGEAMKFFTHKRGLRQGDPLSPMLFNLAVDVLQQMVQVANSTLRTTISKKVNQPILAFQYADDTAIVANGEIETIVTLKIVVRLFTKISGLKINFHKSSFIPINLQEEALTVTQHLLGCKMSSFSISYLRDAPDCFYTK